MKSIFQSKTFYFNALTILVVVAGFFGYTPDAEIVDKATNMLVVIAPFVNIVLRLYTTKAVTIL